MAEDLLAPFRRTAAPAPLPVAEHQPYRAFAVAAGGAKPLRLELRPADGLVVARLYSGLSEIAYDRPDYTGILLVFAARLVKIRGRNLRPVTEALVAGTCEYLAELADAEEPPEGAPVIERIELVSSPAKPGAAESL